MLSRAVELDPNFARAWMMLGLAMRSMPATRSRQIQLLRSSDGENAWKQPSRSTLADPMTRLYMGDLAASTAISAGPQRNTTGAGPGTQ